MLGVAQNPFFSPSDKAMLEVATELGVEKTFKLADLGIYFGDGPGVTKPDPYFDGKGPARTGCIQCGECMTGCHHNAKNTLVKNYLALAERLGITIKPMTTVTNFKLTDDIWHVETRKSSSWLPKQKVLTANQLVVAAGTSTLRSNLRTNIQSLFARLAFASLLI